MVSRATSLLDSLYTTKAVASYSTATEILCERAEPEFRCRRGPCVRTLDRPIEGQAQHVDSERFRVGPRTSQSLRARLRVRETGCRGWGEPMPGLTWNLRKPRNTAKCLPTPSLHFCYPGATGLRFRPGRQPAVEPAAPLSRHNPHDARSSGSGLGAAPRSKFALQRQPSVRQAALEQLPTPMPFTTGSFRACASGSRTANNGVHQLSLRARKIVLSLLNASRPNRVPIEKADTFASCAGDHCRHLIT